MQRWIFCRIARVCLSLSSQTDDQTFSCSLNFPVSEQSSSFPGPDASRQPCLLSVSVLQEILRTHNFQDSRGLIIRKFSYNYFPEALEILISFWQACDKFSTGFCLDWNFSTAFFSFLFNWLTLDRSVWFFYDLLHELFFYFTGVSNH